MNKNETKKYLISFIGDSITDASWIEHNFVSLVGKYLNVDVINLGISGATIGVSKRATGYDNFFTEISKIDTSSNLVVVFGGTNDYGSAINQGIELGKISDNSKYTFCGAINEMIDDLLKNFKKEQIVFMTPLRRDDLKIGYPKSNKNEFDETLNDYVVAMKTICKNKDIECINLYDDFIEYNPENASFNSLSDDGLHPNDKGHKELAKFVSNKLKTVINLHGKGEIIMEKKEKTVVQEEKVEQKKKADKIPPKPNDLGYVSIRNVDKVYDNKVQAVFNFNLDVKKHEFIVFVGPSGCGKSTTLRMIAGLEEITKGDLWIDGVYSNNLTPKDRDIAMVFQSYALYPHMSVYQNMAFGLKMRHVSKEEIDKRVQNAAKILQIEQYLDRKPKELSGGQRQRVALGRAIVRKAKVFLMDEPLSNLDAKLRVQMRAQIVKLHETIAATTIYVTHDQTEAMTMADRIVVMKLGYIQQIGSPIEIYEHPTNLFVATFIGSPSMNILKIRYQNGVGYLSDNEKLIFSKDVIKAHDDFYKNKVGEDEKEILTTTKELEVLKNKEVKGSKKEVNEHNQKIADLNKKLDSLKADFELDKVANKKPHDLAYGIRPENIHYYNEGDEHEDNIYNVKVTVAELLGHDYYIHCDFNGIDLVFRMPVVKQIKSGDMIKIWFHNNKSHIFDPSSEKTIY